MSVQEEFKIIAVRPLEDCDEKYLKVLKSGEFYRFYTNYNIDKITDSITYNKSSYSKLYDIDNLKINISAIVGSNGCGKSTITELLFVMFYNLAVKEGILIEKKGEDVLELVKNIKLDLYYHTDFIRKIEFNGDKILHYKYEETNGIYKKHLVPFENNNFFYTIAINYSHYALNSKILGNWLNELFHKNDGYQTPVVINPMRTEGDIDINNENYLANARMLSILLGPQSIGNSNGIGLRSFVGNRYSTKLKITLNYDKFYLTDEKNEKFLEFVETPRHSEKVLPIVFKYFLDDENFVPKKNHLNKFAIEYIISKLQTISNKYKQYHDYYTHTTFHNLDDYIKELKDDTSHITFKLRHAINFLKHDILPKDKDSFEINIDTLSRSLNKVSKDFNKDIIDLIPPSFLDVDIIFESDLNTFSKLSSGEKQKAYSISSILYHLINLNSVIKKQGITKYKNINIIFDEIELYYHPEYQRTFIFDLLEGIKKASLYNISYLNICFITHSPFILSDIPITNIMFLDLEKTNVINKKAIQITGIQENSFGANIHTLLSKNFFMNNGLIGEFSKIKIQKVINNLQKLISPDVELLKQDEIEAIIEIVGEPFLKIKLREMYNNKFLDEPQKLQRIKDLQNEINQLQND